MLNIENFKKLRASLGKNKAGISFNMSSWFKRSDGKYSNYTSDVEDLNHCIKTKSCGTVMCLAGHAANLASQSPGFKDWHYSVENVAAQWLGLSLGQASYLFNPYCDVGDLDKVKKRAALNMLDKIIRYKRLPTDKSWWTKSVNK